MNEDVYNIFLDMDGVICDWESQFKRYTGGVPVSEYENEHGKRKRYLLVRNHSPAFYATMPYMPDAKVLLNYLKKFNVEILSHAPDEYAVEGKLAWLQNNKINYTPILVNKSSDKSLYAMPNNILIDDKPENIKQFIDAGGIGILHKSADNTIAQLQHLQKSYIKEDSYRIYNSVLNPNIWNGDGTIKDDVAESLISTAKSFYNDTELDVPIEDIYLIGSAASYNWTPTSDLDLHISIDFDKINKDTELVNAYANLLKTKWNSDHDVKIKNHPVEVYLQDINHKSHSLGVYSLQNRKWIKKPIYKVPNIDKESIKKKYRELTSVIDKSISEKNVDNISKLIKKIYDYRQSGLDKKGEFSTENIVFKLIRSTGYLDKLKNAKINIVDKNLSDI
jgi:hypothetical protein